MNEERQRVLVTGATGFIGQHCLPRLVASNFEVHAVWSKSKPDIQQTNVTWHQVDLLNTKAARDVISTVCPTHLFHLAWMATPGVFWNSPENLRWLTSGLSLLDSFGKQGGRRALVIGTCAEYEWGHNTYSEYTTSLNPATIYGRCKLALALGLKAMADVYGFSSAWARMFSPYGPGDHADRFIPNVIRGLLKQEPVMCTEGYQARDFLFIEDVADCLVALLASPVTGECNIGSGQPVTLREIASVIVSQIGHAELVQFGKRPTPDNDPKSLIADIGRLQNELGWQPKFSIDGGIAQTIKDLRHKLM